MLAVIEKVEGGYIARYDRPLKHSVEKVWSALTDDAKLAKWMRNLKAGDLRKGGTMKFDMMDGSPYIDMEILDYEPFKVLEFAWGADRVRFELYPKPEGCLLVLKEFINEVTDHTPKDLAGWHVCLYLMSEMFEERYIDDFPMGEWEAWYSKYKEALGQE